MSDEMFYLEDGVKKDARLHEEMLGSKKAEKLADLLAVKQAVARGMTRKQAEKLFLKGGKR